MDGGGRRSRAIPIHWFWRGGKFLAHHSIKGLSKLEKQLADSGTAPSVHKPVGLQTRRPIANPVDPEVDILRKETTNAFGDQMTILGSLVGLMWAIESLDLFLHGALDRFGIIPRTDIGLRGIILSPFLHGNLQHLIANTVPFLALGWLVMLRRTTDFWTVSLIVMVISGFGTWLLGSPGSTHIGVSGIVFGYLGFLLARAVFERSLSAVFLAIVAGSLYGSMIWGISPFQRGISWEGHLCGLIGGGVAAWLMAKADRQTKIN